MKKRGHKGVRTVGVLELLKQVKDRESFLAFVKALMEESELAEKMEREEPEKYRFCAPLGWENRSISSFIGAALACVEDGSYFEEANWRGFAEFLYCGKIYG
ncbi:MAG TPA: hypothetical protein VFV58_16275 [Blastocatellia bacterium]|nr:hypothetical protein [Blastocatellia bacterium]